MATKVLSIEIGQGLTRVVEMDYKVKNPKVYNYFTFETPKDVIDDGMVKRSEAFTALFKAECEKRGIKTTQVVFSVNSSRIARREVKIPLVKEKQIQSLLDTSATDYFPVDMTSYHLAYDIVEKIAKGDDKGYRLNLIAVPNDLTASYFDFAQALGCRLVAVDYVGNSVYQVAGDSFKTGLNVLLKVDEHTSLITVLKDGKIDLQRTITYGINEAVEAVQKNTAFGENLTYAQAVSVLCGKTCIRRVLNPEEGYKEKEDTDNNITEARIEVTDSLRYLVGMINRVLEYYASHNESVQIDAITLVGLGADFSGLSKLLTNELNHKVKVLQDGQVDIVNKVAGESTLRISRFVACLGAAMAPMNLIPDQGKGAKVAGGAKTSNSITGGIVVLALFLVLAGALSGIALLGEKDALNEQEALNSKIEQLQPAQQTYDVYVQTKANYDDFISKYNMTVTPNSALYDFIQELEQKMPSSIQLVSFVADGVGVNMSMTVDTKVEAADAIMQLRTFESLSDVDSAGITDNVAEDGTSTVTFTVNCTYAQPAPLN